ncbi:MAG: 7-cyano-7-deazaguanine synthase [Candidatus Heimdallarchaeota archaeon LC_3]|nr:MAG: 7-cyano-7-deazaguanine synthase [Candidatus Heimdallarchaeota archaeon LC_3]
MDNLAKKAVVLCSGGMDSVTVLGLASKNNYDCHSLFVNYGQKTVNKERESSIIASKIFSSHFKEIELFALKEITETSLIHNTGETEVQGRNAVLISLAVSYAQTIGASVIFIGLQSQDVHYKDARKEFLDNINSAMKFAYNVEILAPLLNKSKVEIIKMAGQLNIDLNLTYSCYFDPEKPCGKCPSCVVRLSAEKELKK